MKFTSIEDASCAYQRYILLTLIINTIFKRNIISIPNLKGEVGTGGLEGVEEVVGALINSLPHVEGLSSPEPALVVEDVHVDPGERGLGAPALVEHTEADPRHSRKLAHLAQDDYYWCMQ